MSGILRALRALRAREARALRARVSQFYAVVVGRTVRNISLSMQEVYKKPVYCVFPLHHD